MARFVFLLLSARLRLIWNSFRRGTVGARIGWILAGIALAVAALFSGLAGFGLSRLLEFFTRSEVQDALGEMGLPAAQVRPELLLGTVLSLLVTAVWGVVLLTSLGAALNGFYLSSDLDLLIAAPIPMRAIFAAKYAEGLGVGYLLLFALGGPALVGLGWGAGYRWPYYLGAVLVLFLLPLVPESLGTLLVMPLVRVIPPKRLREVLQVLGALVGAGFYLFTQLAPSERMSAEQAGRLVRLLYRLNLPYLPQGWAPQSLLALGQGKYLEGGIALVAFGLLSVGLFSLSLLLAERLYYSGWASLQSAPAVRRRQPRREGAQVTGRPVRAPGDIAFLSRPVQGILLKDLRLFSRAPQGWSEMVMPLAVYVLLIVQMLARGDGPAAGNTGLALLGLSAFVFFLSNSMVSRLGLGGIGSEGKQAWLLKVAPVSPQRILWGKFLAAYIPYLLLSGLMLLGLTLFSHSAWTFFLGNWLLVSLIGMGALGIGVGLGATFPRFESERKRQGVSPGAGCLYFPLILLYAGLISALLLLPPAVDGLLRAFGMDGLAAFLWAFGPPAAAVLSAVALFVPLRIGARRLALLDL